MQALDGVRVLDLSRILTGPYCTMMLADLGAEVIKVEPPGSGDDTRQWGPPFIHGESAYFLSVNRNKKSITLNLKHPKGQEVLRGLVRTSDVLVENFRPGTLQRMGFTPEACWQLNPGLVYASISGFGQTGPYRDRPGYDVLAQAMGGMMAVTGEPDGGPIKAGMSIADIGAGMFAAFGILAALRHRDRTGKGQVVDCSLLETMIAWHTYQATNYFVSGKLPRRLGTAHPNIVPYQAFEAADGWVIIACANDSLWKKFCAVAGLEHLPHDPRFETNPARVAHREELLAFLGERVKLSPVAWWVEELEKAGVPAGPINNFDAIYSDPHVLARGMLVEADHPAAGRIKLTGSPVHLSETPGSVRLPPPLLGEHTEEVLEGLGYAPSDIAALRADGVL